MESIILIIVAYLVGSLPTGYLIGWLNGVDVMSQGSRNIGFTNVRRLLGTTWGLVTLIIDFGKATLFLWLLVPHYATTEHTSVLQIICGLFIIIGNTKSVWLKFKGGKGVATSAGVFAVIFPYGLIPAVILFLLVLIITNYLSAGSLAGALTMVLVRATQIIIDTEGMFNWEATVLNLLIILTVVLVIIHHRNNIKRLLSGTEPKFRVNKQGVP